MLTEQTRFAFWDPSTSFSDYNGCRRKRFSLYTLILTVPLRITGAPQALCFSIKAPFRSGGSVGEKPANCRALAPKNGNRPETAFSLRFRKTKRAFRASYITSIMSKKSLLRACRSLRAIERHGNFLDIYSALLITVHFERSDHRARKLISQPVTTLSKKEYTVGICTVLVTLSNGAVACPSAAHLAIPSSRELVTMAEVQICQSDSVQS